MKTERKISKLELYVETVEVNNVMSDMTSLHAELEQRKGIDAILSLRGLRKKPETLIKRLKICRAKNYQASRSTIRQAARQALMEIVLESIEITFEK